MSNIGWKGIVLKPNMVGQTEIARDFQRGFALRLRQGASNLARLALRNGNDRELETADLYDGRTIACPNGFDEIEVTWPDDAIPGLTRCYVEVLQRPAAVDVMGSDHGPLSARRVYPSPLHGPAASISIAIGAFAMVCDAPADLWQYPDNVGAGLTLPYQSNKVGDARAPWRPSASLFFDGFIAGAQHANFEVWIYAYTFIADGTPVLNFYRTLTGGAIASEGAGPPTTVPAQTSLHVARLAETSGVGMIVPADGFQMWVKNTSGVAALNVRGYIGARSA